MYTVLDTIPFDQLNAFRLQKSYFEFDALLGRRYQLEESIIREMLTTPVQLAVVALEHNYCSQEELYNFVSDYFRNPCEIRLERVEDLLHMGITQYPSNSNIALRLGRAHYAKAVKDVQRGKTEQMAIHMKNVEYYFELASTRMDEEVPMRTMSKNIRAIAYRCLNQLRRTQT